MTLGEIAERVERRSPGWDRLVRGNNDRGRSDADGDPAVHPALSPERHP